MYYVTHAMCVYIIFVVCLCQCVAVQQWNLHIPTLTLCFSGGGYEKRIKTNDGKERMEKSTPIRIKTDKKSDRKIMLALRTRQVKCYMALNCICSRTGIGAATYVMRFTELLLCMAVGAFLNVPSITIIIGY